MYLKEMRGALTMPQFLALDLHLFPKRRPEGGWPPPEHELELDTDDMSMRYVCVACSYLVHGSTYEIASRYAGRDWKKRSISRARQMVGRFVRINAKALEEKHGLRYL